MRGYGNKNAREWAVERGCTDIVELIDARKQLHMERLREGAALHVLRAARHVQLLFPAAPSLVVDTIVCYAINDDFALVDVSVSRLVFAYCSPDSL